ncbi:MAG: aminotransferase class III-fold pyridoxal phosphate-dependent enzyme [Deferribacterota bacterium]|nr:aminotransferase class III-fold pyridoxal phosphate-dependent enzyme [Deferribacterota bacterium]
MMSHRHLVELYNKKFLNSKLLFENYKNIFPRGVCHNIRNIKPFPFITKKTNNIYLYDIDDNKLIDLWMGHYTHILGHSNMAIINKVKEVLDNNAHVGTVNIYQYELAEILCDAIPFIDKLRFCCSGTEATMYATRVAQAYTGKNIIVKMEGGWHGGNPDLSHFIQAPYEGKITNHTIAIPFNDKKTSEELLEAYRGKIGCIILEPVMGSVGSVLATNEYLSFLRDYTEKNNIVLIFDEIISAFRFCYGSISNLYNIEPDLITMGKIIGGGFPIGAYGGRKDIMEIIEKKDIVVGGGTFSANPISMVAGKEMLKLLKDKNYTFLNKMGSTIKDKVNSFLNEMNLNAFSSGYGSMFSLIFVKNEDYIYNMPSTFIYDVDSKMNNMFQAVALLGNMFTMHGGGALSFLHLEESLINKIIEIYYDSLVLLRENLDE